MHKHRNSQKRYYYQNGTYFITTKTYQSYPFFKEDIFCKLLIEEFKLCQNFKGFHLYGYKINPDHVHLLIQPYEKNNYSKIMHFIKRHFSRNCNIIMGYNESGWVENKSDKIGNNSVEYGNDPKEGDIAPIATIDFEILIYSYKN